MDMNKRLLILARIARVYALPIIVADRRNVIDTKGILSLNLFFGWTVVGWAAALIWAFRAETKCSIGLAG